MLIYTRCTVYVITSGADQNSKINLSCKLEYVKMRIIKSKDDEILIFVHLSLPALFDKHASAVCRLSYSILDIRAPFFMMCCWAEFF